MDENERYQLKQAYSQMPDSEILEMFSAGKEAYQDKEVFNLIYNEMKKRELSIKKEDKKEEQQQEEENKGITCFKCGYPNKKKYTSL